MKGRTRGSGGDGAGEALYLLAIICNLGVDATSLIQQNAMKGWIL